MAERPLPHPFSRLLLGFVFAAVLLASCSSGATNAEGAETVTSSDSTTADVGSVEDDSRDDTASADSSEDTTSDDASDSDIADTDDDPAATSESSTSESNTSESNAGEDETSPDAEESADETDQGNEATTVDEADENSDNAEITTAETTTTSEPGSTTTSDPATNSESETTSTTEATSAPTTTEAPAPRSELDVLIDELSAYVEAERGLTFQSRPEIALLNNSEFSDAWLELIEDDATENAVGYRNFTDIYQAMGIISTDTDLEQIWTRFGEAGVLGYYETDTKQIRLRNGEIDALAKTTLVHELVHALEDQNFDLSRESYSDRDDEISWAFSALTEGSARVIENRYRASLSQAERDEEQVALSNLPRTVSFSEFNQSFLELQFGRYNYGEVFAEALWDQGQSAIDDAFRSPPTSSELVLDPASFINGVSSDAPVDPPPAEGAVFEDGVWGEAAWIAVLSDTFGTREALDLADGWGGDWYVAWRNGSETCVRIDVSADSSNEFDEYESALEKWVEGASGRDLTSPETNLLRLTACQ